MPKISKKTIKIRTDKADKSFDIEVYYNQDNSFYVQVPSVFDDAFDHLTALEKKELSASVVYKNTRQHYSLSTTNCKRIVSAQTEHEAISAMSNLLHKLIHTQIQLREVIILFYHNRTVNYNHHTYTNEFEPIGLQLGITYCTEAQVSGGTKNYYQYSTYTAFGEEHTKRKEISIYRESCVIIDDTPTNREFVEGIYNAMKILDEKLVKFTATPEALIGLIESNQKLLN